MRRWKRGRVAQLVRAFDSHSRGHRFESCRVHHMKNIDSIGQRNRPGETGNIPDWGKPQTTVQNHPSKPIQPSQTGGAQGVGIANRVNLLKPLPGKKPKSRLKWVFLILAAVILFFGAVMINRAADLSEKIFAGQTTTFFGKVWEVFRGATGGVALKGENSGQINILLLGIGGPVHEGPYLTDTMIVAQIRPKESEVAFVSIPRDTLAALPNNLGERKINAVFAEGIARTKDFSQAGRWATMAAERLSGQTIPYFAVIDFEGFKKAIDEIKGLDITVEKTFTDAEFPDEKLGYLPPVTFEAGEQHMDGTKALIYARSRHGNNGEGSDFARGLRQQKVMKAFKDKILDMNVLTSLGRLNSLMGIFADNFHTNLTPGEILRLYDIAKDQNIQTFLSLNLGLETGRVCATSHETAGYIIVPCAGRTSADIQNFFKNAFSLGKLTEERATVWLGDSTQNPSRLKQTEAALKEAGLTVWPLSYDKDDYPQTIVFQVNPKPATLEYIKNTLHAKSLSLPPPGVKVDPSKVDIIVILGKN